jgi:hypothetical protein
MLKIPKGFYRVPAKALNRQIQTLTGIYLKISLLMQSAAEKPPLFYNLSDFFRGGSYA